MTRVSSLGKYLLICDEPDAVLLGSTALGQIPVLRKQGLCIFSVEPNAVRLQQALDAVKHEEAPRYLFDKFHLWISRNDRGRWQKLLDKFFGLIADEYEALIDIPRNIENISNLLGFLSSLVGPLSHALVVDYGCGTGLSIRPGRETSVTLIGVDRCPRMRAIATSRGMLTWSPGDLARQLSGSVHAAFASYVLHLLPETHGLRLLWARLKPGGVLVANFHKGQGIELVADCLSEQHALIRRLDSPAGAQRHGPYFAYVKQK